MDSVMDLITDRYHWLGWFITTSIIYLVFWILMSKNPHFNVYGAYGILLGIIVVVDVIKHKTGLQ